VTPALSCAATAPTIAVTAKMMPVMIAPSLIFALPSCVWLTL
jgi:hypothetical protein